MDIQRIRYFIEAAKCNNFSKAAQKFYISPQAMTKQISILEDELALALFDRNNRKVTLNENGKFVLDVFEKLNIEVEKAYHSIENYQIAQKNTIRIGFFASLSKSTLIYPLIHMIKTQLPHINIDIQMIDVLKATSLLLDDDIDLCFTNIHDEENLIGCDAHILSTSMAKVAVAKSHPWAKLEKISLKDLSTETFIKMDPAIHTHHYTTDHPFYENIPCKKIMHATNFETTCTLIKEELGFGVMPEAYENQEYSDIVFIDYPGLSVKFHTVALYKEPHYSKAIDDILELVKSSF